MSRPLTENDKITNNDKMFFGQAFRGVYSFITLLRSLFSFQLSYISVCDKHGCGDFDLPARFWDLGLMGLATNTIPRKPGFLRGREEGASGSPSQVGSENREPQNRLYRPRVTDSERQINEPFPRHYREVIGKASGLSLDRQYQQVRFRIPISPDTWGKMLQLPT